MTLQNSRPYAWLIALFFGFFFLYFAVRNAGYFDASDSQARFYMIRSLLTTGSPNWQIPGIAEPQICLNSIGPALAAVPFMAIGYLLHQLDVTALPLQQTLIQFTLYGTVFYTAVWMCLLAYLCTQLGASRGQATVVSLLAGTCTLILPYSKSAQAENLVGMCITLILILLLKHETRQALRFPVIIGLVFGFLLTCKNELIIVLPLLMLALVFSPRSRKEGRMLSNLKSVTAMLAATVPGVAVVLLYNYLRFGDVTDAGHLGNTWDGPLFKPFDHPFARGLYLQLFSPGKGLIWYCPILLASLPLTYHFLKRQTRTMLVPYIWWVMMTCLYAKWYSPAGDTALGSRFQVSYLAFAVLPVLHLFQIRTPKLKAGLLVWLIICGLVSFLLQLLFSAVSFGVLFQHVVHPHPPLIQLDVISRMYYDPAHSPILGYIGLLRDGLLDLYYIRLKPLEGALTILPGFWYCLAASSAGFTLARLCCKAENKFPFRQVLSFGNAIPGAAAVAFLIAGILELGSRGDRGLRLKLESDGNGRYETQVQDIDIPSLNYGREVYTLGGAFTMDWSGEFLCPVPGMYQLSTSSTLPLSITLAHQQQAVLPGNHTRSFMVLDKGWQPLQITSAEAGLGDGVEIRYALPQSDAFLALREAELKVD